MSCAIERGNFPPWRAKKDLESERDRLLLEEQTINSAFWFSYPQGERAKALDSRLEEILIRLDAVCGLLERMVER